MGAPKIKQLRGMSDKKLEEMNDNISTHTVVGTSYYLDELNRRIQERNTNIIKKHTIAITVMTAFMALSTIINVILFYQCR